MDTVDPFQAERFSLMQTSRDWASAASTKDVDLTVSFWADDAVVLPPGRGPVVGKEAIRKYVLESLAITGFEITWEPEQAFISPGKDLGYLAERNRTTFLDQNGKRQIQDGKAVTVWAKDPIGKWKCKIDIWNDYPPGR